MASQAPVRTALYEEHLALDANIVDFHGFELPIWYTNISEEHLACRAMQVYLMFLTWVHSDFQVAESGIGLNQ